MDREPSPNMIKDIIKMVEYELHDSITEDNAICIGRKLLSKAKERDDVHRVPTTRLERLVQQCKKNN
jgi:hypothetical protein